MRILLIAPRFHTNQVSFVKKLIEEKHTVGIYVIGRGINEEYRYLEPVEIPLSKVSHWFLGKRVKNDFAKFANRALPKLLKYIKMVKSFSPDVIIIRGATTPVYARVLMPFIFIVRYKVVFYTQGPKYVKKIKRLRRIHDWFVIKILKVRWFTPVLFRETSINECINLTYIDYVPFFMYPGIEEGLERRMPDVVSFICVGKFEPRKKIKLLIETFSFIAKKNAACSLTIIGNSDSSERNAYFKECEELIREKALEPTVLLLKNVPHEQISSYYLKSHIMILPSINEPASISELEAMSFGLAIITSKDNGSAHYIKNGLNGYVIEVNSDNLLETIMIYINNPELALIHGKESLRLIREDLSVDKSYKRLMNVINS
ncbi:MAG: glycosyltransferase family 4 protein [Bacteroidales bacterium]|jgi:glycosyltransferase involved in cell wall biosynthesis|nr:glycosyltransferase family 4 protein [Bacteroidales bacterium]